MTRFDIRIRRRQFTQSRIERHKDFQNLLGNYDRTSRKKTRGVMVLVILMILIVAILSTFFGALIAPEEKKPKEKEDVISKNIRTEGSMGEPLTVYELSKTKNL